jgi:ribonuclease HII
MQHNLLFDLAGGLMAGVDEVGRGPLAGPWSPPPSSSTTADRSAASTTRSCSRAARRAEAGLLRRDPRQGAVLQVGRGDGRPRSTPQHLQAALLAMSRAVDGPRLPPQVVFVDGNQRPR